MTFIASRKWHVLSCVARNCPTGRRIVSCGGYNYDPTSIRRPFDCLSKVIKVTVT